VGETDGALSGTPVVHLENVVAVLRAKHVTDLPRIECIHPSLKRRDNLPGSNVAQAPPVSATAFLPGGGVVGVAEGKVGEGDALIERVRNLLNRAVGRCGVLTRARANENVAHVDRLFSALVKVAHDGFVHFLSHETRPGQFLPVAADVVLNAGESIQPSVAGGAHLQAVVHVPVEKIAVGAEGAVGGILPSAHRRGKRGVQLSQGDRRAGISGDNCVFGCGLGVLRVRLSGPLEPAAGRTGTGEEEKTNRISKKAH
jgi:hypothetical protein